MVAPEFVNVVNRKSFRGPALDATPNTLGQGPIIGAEAYVPFEFLLELVIVRYIGSIDLACSLLLSYEVPA